MGVLAAIAKLAPVVIWPTIRAVEALFGPKTGDVKMKAVLEALRPILEKLAAAGKLPGPAPGEAELAALVEAQVQQLKAAGELGGGVAVPAAVPGVSLQIPAGYEVVIRPR